MPLYRYRITPLSPFATPMRSDTIYGHLLWAAAMLQGESKVTDLIHAFREGVPPFVLSSAFPEGRLPMPVLPNISRTKFNEQFSEKGRLFEQLQRYKTFRKQPFWNMEQWLASKGKISQEMLFTSWLVDEAGKVGLKKHPEKMPEMKTAVQPHVSIDRQSGSVLDQGGLFFSKGTWYRPGMTLDLYVEADDLNTFETLFNHVADVGFGADRTTGKGQFKYAMDTAFDPTPFDMTGTHRLTLSVCASADLSAFKGFWSPMIKHGRAWNGFGEQNPYKKPFLAFAEGSVFSQMPEKDFVLQNIHSNPDIVQIGWPLTIPVTLEAHHEN